MVVTDPVKGNYATDVGRVRLGLTVPEVASVGQRAEIYDTVLAAVSDLLFAGMVKDFDLPT